MWDDDGLNDVPAKASATCLLSRAGCAELLYSLHPGRPDPPPVHPTSHSTWFTELDTFASQNVVKYIVGNKTDREFARTVSKAEAQTFATSKGCLFKEVSAKRNDGIQQVFEQLVDEVSESLLRRCLVAAELVQRRLSPGYTGQEVAS